MKKIIAIVLAVTLLASLSGVALAGKGNGAPSGPHYNLNIIGMSQDNAKECEEGGHVIFVKLKGKSTIKLTADDIVPYEFKVIECDGVTGDAEFQLPVDVSDTYTVWARALGKPKGTANMMTCATEKATGTQWCYVDEIGLKLTRGHGKQWFTDVSKYLLFVYVCEEYDPITGDCIKWKKVKLFDPAFENYLWEYDNKGLKLAQLRFYPVTD